MTQFDSNGDYKTYRNHRAEPYFSFVKDGIKTIEGRLKKGWYEEVVVGDHVIVYNNEEIDNVEVQVKALRTYDSFREMLENENLHQVLPNAKSVDEGVEIYRQFYDGEQEKQFGVIAIEVERV